MELVIGILIGLIIGSLLSLLPGFNLGLAMLVVINLPNPRFGVGLLLGIDLASSILEILKKNKDKESCQNVAYEYFFFKILLSLAFSVIIFINGNSIIKLNNQFIAIVGSIGSLYIWVSIIKKSKIKVFAAIILIFSLLSAVISIKLPTQYNMLVYVSSIYVSEITNAFKVTKSRADSKENLKSESEWKEVIEGLLVGIPSAFLWGIPVAAGLKVVESEQENEDKKGRREAIANASASVIGLVIMLTTGGARSAVASNAASFNENFHYSEVCVILLILLGLNLVVGIKWNSIIEVYSRVNISNPVISKLIGLLTISILTIISGGFFLPLALVGLMIDKWVKITQSPSELKLAGLSLLPIINLF